MTIRLDRVDGAIVNALLEDGRISNKSLAERAGVAPSTCVARLRSLVERGVIAGFSAVLDLDRLGLPVQAVIAVRLKAQARGVVQSTFDDLRHLPEVCQIFFVGGEDDYLMHVAVADTKRLKAFVVQHLSARTDVASTRTSIIFDHDTRVPVKTSRS